MAKANEAIISSSRSAFISRALANLHPTELGTMDNKDSQAKFLTFPRLAQDGGRSMRTTSKCSRQGKTEVSHCGKNKM